MERTSIAINIKLLSMYFAMIVSLLFLWGIDTPEKTLLILSIAYIGIGSLIKPLFEKKVEALSPEVLLPFVYMMYALGPLVSENLYYEIVFEKYLIIQLIGLLSLFLGLKVVKTKETNNHADISEKKDNNILLYTSFLFTGISIFSVATEIIAFGGVGGLLSVGYGEDRFLTLGNARVFGAGFQWLILCGVLFWYTGYRNKSIYQKNIGLLIGFVSFAILFLTGGRSTIVYALLYFIVIFHFEMSQISNRKIILTLLIGIMVAQLYSNARYYLPEGIINTIVNTYKIFVNDPESFLPLPKNISEFQSPARTLLDVLNGNEHFRLHGKSYVTAIGSPFPIINKIMAKHGIDINTWYLMNYQQSLFIKGGGAGLSPVTEGYVNFGYIGVILHMFIYGLVSSIIFNYYRAKKNVLSLLFYAGLLPMIALDGMRIHLASSLYKLFRVFWLPAFLFFLIRFVYNIFFTDKESRRL